MGSGNEDQLAQRAAGVQQLVGLTNLCQWHAHGTRCTHLATRHERNGLLHQAAALSHIGIHRVNGEGAYRQTLGEQFAKLIEHITRWWACKDVVRHCHA